MNYLAHALLSPEDPTIVMGNLWGDLLRPKDYLDLDPGIMTGVMKHKIIDTFTDQHPNVEEMVLLFRPGQGKYAPVVADVLMDFILSKFWHAFHTETIEQFSSKVYQMVKTHIHLMPERLNFRIERMLENQWLESCKNRQRMEMTLLMLSRRASFANNIPNAMQPYDANEQTMDRLFLTFFQDLRMHLEKIG